MANVQIKNIGLNKIMEAAIHGPRVADHPMYVNVKGMEQDIPPSRDRLWIAASENTFNSPTNLRRLFIYSTGVTKEYFVAPKRSGNDGERIVSTTYSSVTDVKLEELGSPWEPSLYGETPILSGGIHGIIKRKLLFEQHWQTYSMAIQQGMKPEAPYRITVAGTGISAIKAPWVCTNLEEIYFDCSLFVIDKLFPTPPAQDILRKVASGATEVAESSVPAHLVMFALGVKSIADLKIQFPRLKVIGFLSNLQQAVPHIKGEEDLLTIQGKLNPEPWVVKPRIKDLLGRIGGLQYVNKTGKFEPNLKFDVRSGIYRFDEEILKPRVEKYLENLKTGISVVESATSTPSSPEENKSDFIKDRKSELEQQLSAYDNTTANKVCCGLIIIYGVEFWREELAKMSAEGKQKYSGIKV